MGWPPTNVGWSTAATREAFTLPTSVMTRSEFHSVESTMLVMTEAAAWTGVATTTRSAARSRPSASRAPSSTARAATPAPASTPRTCQPRPRSAMPTDPPMRPVPKIMARPGAPPGPGRVLVQAVGRGPVLVGEVVTESLRALEVDVVDLVTRPLGGDVEHDPDASDTEPTIESTRAQI